MTWRTVTTVLDENTRLFTMYSIDPAGNEEVMMEMTYARK